jgi:hypothetical protein
MRYPLPFGRGDSGDRAHGRDRRRFWGVRRGFRLGRDRARPRGPTIRSGRRCECSRRPTDATIEVHVVVTSYELNGPSGTDGDVSHRRWKGNAGACGPASATRGGRRIGDTSAEDVRGASDLDRRGRIAGCGPKGIRTPDLLAASQTGQNGVPHRENAGRKRAKRPQLFAECPSSPTLGATVYRRSPSPGSQPAAHRYRAFAHAGSVAAVGRHLGLKGNLDPYRARPNVEILPALLVRESAGDALAGQAPELVDRKEVQADRPVGARRR